MSQKKIFVAGHRGMVGGAIVRQLLARGVAADRIVTRTHSELDLTNQAAVQAFFAQNPGIGQVYLAAAKVGGIHANNTYPAEFIYQNLILQANVVHQAFAAGVKRLLFLGSSCIYPRMAPQPKAETRCSRPRWSRPTSPMRLPRSLASSCARATTASTAPATASTTAA